MKLGLQLHLPLSSQVIPVEPSPLQLQALKKQRKSVLVLGQIHLPHLWIRKFFYGQLESYGSISTYGQLETYGSVNFHDLIFFGSKCLKLPKTLRKVVNLWSKNFQCIYLINTWEFSKKNLEKNFPKFKDNTGFSTQKASF